MAGTVADSSGKVVVGAKVTAVNSGTDDTYNTTTNQDGYFRIDFIRVGTYNVSAEYPGFSRSQKTGTVVDVKQVRNDFTLTPGSVSESITVEAGAQVIKTDDATISAIISTRQLSDLPMMGRDPMSLATTTREIQNSMSLRWHQHHEQSDHHDSHAADGRDGPGRSE